MSIAKGNLILPIVNLDHSERDFVFCLAGFKNDLTSSVFMQPFGKAGVALNTCYSLPFPSCKLLLPNILWFFVFPFVFRISLSYSICGFCHGYTCLRLIFKVTKKSIILMY